MMMYLGSVKPYLTLQLLNMCTKKPYLLIPLCYLQSGIGRSVNSIQDEKTVLVNGLAGLAMSHKIAHFSALFLCIL